MYIEVPNLKIPYNDLRREYFAMYHLSNFTEYTLKKLLENTGFKILKEQQIAGTSICFICKKEIIESVNQSFDSNQYYKVITILKRYENLYPLIKLKKEIVKILDLLGLKNFIKRLLNK